MSSPFASDANTDTGSGAIGEEQFSLSLREHLPELDLSAANLVIKTMKSLTVLQPIFSTGEGAKYQYEIIYIT